MDSYRAQLARDPHEANKVLGWLLAESEWKRTGETKAEESEIPLTPTEELLLDVLIARHRLGHDLWTIGSNAASRKAADSLADKGLVITLNGIVEKTFRARLTGEARRRYMGSDYTPPILGGPK
ncbi:conserved hypothetical protein [Rhodococcus phage E3]|uniref:hypothetical protein n=1 Tax=Rhodococcus phage E3 TaxID=1007869 RepID=UPI0002C6983E|nr:hypothetical protein M176_gp056 [Rhodococcus phage E3]AEQ20966.1 conserved hypothetical protein [Rhodococcus phage E3]